MQTFFIPLLDFLYRRLERGFTRRQKTLAVLLGMVVLANFMFRAGCPPERRFFRSPTSQTISLCASPDMVRNALPLGRSRSARSSEERPQPVL